MAKSDTANLNASLLVEGLLMMGVWGGFLAMVRILIFPNLCG